MPENVASWRILTKMTASVFHKAISIFFAGMNIQYMDIYHTKKQTENIARSCSYLLLKTLFYFISQCTSASYLESGLCKLDNELDNCILHLFSRETDLLMKAIIKCVNIKLWDILGSFHYILNAPRMRKKNYFWGWRSGKTQSSLLSY